MVASTDPVPVMPMPYPAFRRQAVAVAVAPVEAAQQPDDIAVASIGDAPVPVARPADLEFDEAVQAAKGLAARPAIANGVPDGSVDVIGAWLSDTFSLGAAPAPLGQTRPSAPLLPPVGIGDEGEPIDLMTSGGIGDTAPDIITEQPEPAPLAVAAVEEPATVAAPGWIVQIGAAPTENGANQLISHATAKLNSLNGVRPYVERFEKNGQVFFRARFDGFDGREDAAGLCSELKKAKMSCLAMQS